MRSVIPLLVPLAGLVTAQGHLAVLAADGISVGYHDDASDSVSPPVDLENTSPEVPFTSSSLSLQSQPVKAHTPVVSSAEGVAIQPVFVSVPTESPTGQLAATSPVSGTAPRNDGRCGAKFDNAICDPNGMYGGCCS